MPDPLTSTGIMAYIAEHSIETVEAFINALPDTFKRHFLLVFKSEAPNADDVSEDEPRVISWGPDGRLILTWITDSDGDHYESVEFMEMHDSGWDLGVIDFSEDSPS